MTRPVIRDAGPSDEPIVKNLQKKHLEGLDCFGPYPEDAYWIVADLNGKIVNAIGYIDRPDECQIMMLWEPGREAAVAAHLLVNKVYEEVGNKTFFFISHDGIPEQTKRMYAKWGYTKLGGNGTISLYAKAK